MGGLSLTAAFGDYDRTAPLRNGTVRPENIDLRVLTLPPSEIFARMIRRREFDVSEMSMGALCHLAAGGRNPFVGIPAFPSKAFRHTMVYVNAGAGIETPADLNGKRIAIREWGMTALVWIVGILSEEYGFDFRSADWVAAIPPRADIRMPEGGRLRYMAEGETLSGLLDAGAVDAALIHQVPVCFAEGSPRVRRLFPDYKAAEIDYYRRTGVHPIMHCVVLRKETHEDAPWAARSLFDALEEARRAALANLLDYGAFSAMVPFLPEAVDETLRIFGPDFWPYGIEKNRATLEKLFLYAHQQGLTERPLAAEELFDESLHRDATP